jgi:N-acetylglucosaminyldiphosphoundecaprenol N-acetyl-beta-D-mannosaminyltransferase
MKKHTEDVMGYAVDIRDVAGCANNIVEWMKKGDSCRWLACLNPYSYEVSLKDETFSRALKDADWLLPDGIGIVIASRVLGGVIRERITGYDIFTKLNETLNIKRGFKVYFLGAEEKTLEMIRDNMTKDFPGIRVVGSYSPPFTPEYSRRDLDRMIRKINSTQPDVLWIGMTAPKQEKWIFKNKDRLNVKFVGAIGAVFDFYAGKVKRANPFYRKLGLEWLVRLIREPRRLWRRYLISAPLFLWDLLMMKISKIVKPTFYFFRLL